MNNHMRRHQMGWVYQVIKLALLSLSGILTYGFLSRFLADFWFRILALVLYEGGLLFWHYVHHYKSETARQHMFSRNMERLSLVAVGSAAGYQLLTLVSAGFGDSLPTWTHTAIEIATAVVFMVQLFAFTKWEKLSHYYTAVEQAFNHELASGQASMIQGVLASTASVKIVESDTPSVSANLSGPESPSEADVDAFAEHDLEGSQDALGSVQKMLTSASQKLPIVRLEDRTVVLELLKKEHPDWTQKQIAQQTGLSIASIRRWQQGK